MGAENLNIARVVRLVIVFLVVDLLIYSGFVLHPLYSKFFGDDIPLAKKEDTATQQPLSPTHSTTSLLLGGSASPHSAFGDQHEAKGALDGGSVKEPLVTSAPHSNTTSRLILDTSYDSNNWGLSSQQCSDQFSGLFTEINRAVAFQKQKGVVTPEDIDISWKDDGAVRAQIIDQKLYILEAKVTSDHPRMRSIALLSAINRAITTSPHPIPNVEVSFIASDIADESHTHRTLWALTRLPVEEETWVMSDFGYWSWAVDLIGGYEDVRKQVAGLEMDFEKKEKKVVWRGARKTNPMRELLLKETKGKAWADVESVDWRDSVYVKIVEAIGIPEHCKYQFVLQTEGRSYSGRLKYLQNCNSVVIIPKRKWVEPQHSLLISSGPEQNFVEIEEDFSNMEATVLALLADEEKAKRIARNGVEIFRDKILTPGAQNCYWRKMLQGWSEVSFRPEKDERGVNFETFIVQEAMGRKNYTWLRKLTLKC